MPAIVSILTFMSRINFSLSWAEHEKSFITSGPGPALNSLYSQKEMLEKVSKKNISEASSPILIKFNVNLHWVGELTALGF